MNEKPAATQIRCELPVSNGCKLPPPATPDLRQRLVAMREALVEGLAVAPHLDGGYLALLGHTGAALAAIDAPPVPAICAPCADASRAVVGDDGLTISLALYHGDQTVGAVVLTPLRALQLAGDLLAAGLRRVALPAWAERG